MKKKGFTLIELLSVVVILGVLFFFITPKINTLIKSGERKEIELIEERVLSAAKEYANENANFYDNLKNVGDSNYVYKSELLRQGLIDENEISKLDNFVRIKGELLENDKISYRIMYLDNNQSAYTTEELYQMIQDLSNRITSNSANISAKSPLDSYPVGSIYISTTNTNPGTIFGGTWVAFGEGRTLVGVDTTQEEFDTVEETGGEKGHTLTIDEMSSHNHTSRLYLDQSGYGVTIPKGASYFKFSKGDDIISWNSSAQTDKHIWSIGTSTATGGSQAHNNLQPYITVYMWRRTA